jgi:hypothetical protein
VKLPFRGPKASSAGALNHRRGPVPARPLYAPARDTAVASYASATVAELWPARAESRHIFSTEAEVYLRFRNAGDFD